MFDALEFLGNPAPLSVSIAILALQAGRYASAIKSFIRWARREWDWRNRGKREWENEIVDPTHRRFASAVTSKPDAAERRRNSRRTPDR